MISDDRKPGPAGPVRRSASREAGPVRRSASREAGPVRRSAKREGGYVIGVDIGGTFTDCAVIDASGDIRTGKVPTRPADRARSFFESIEDAARKFDFTLAELLSRCERLVHGTTTGTNALITRTGARVGLLTTAGHRDVPFIMKGAGRLAGLNADRVLDLPHTDKPQPLVPKDLVAEVVERTDFEGDVIVPLDEASASEALARLTAQGVDALAVSFLWSIRNPLHERLVGEMAHRAHPELFVSCASDVSSRVGEYERTMTAVINAYIGPLMNSYVRAIELEARRRGYEGQVLYAQCAGGAITVAEAQTAPIRTVQSGPVSGTLGSVYLATRLGEPNVIVTDMGGTSFDVSVIRNGSPDLRESSFLERFEIALPMVFVDSIGAGGGSIAWIDDAGGLQVGPQSAGAVPGPACYAAGGKEPTVTDADVVLGIINPDRFLHGALRLDRDAAVAAVSRLADRLGLSSHETAAGINRIVDNKMADLLRRISVMRGLDPRDFVCFAYGGMGPVHAAAIARDVGMKRLIVPLVQAAPVWSAFGAAVSDVVHVYQRWQNLPLPAPAHVVTPIFEELEKQARDVLRREGFDEERTELRRFVRMKYAVQVFDLEVPMAGSGVISDADLTEVSRQFARLYSELNGEASGHPEGGIEITGFVVRAQGLTDAPHLTAVQTVEAVERSTRPVYWEERSSIVETPVVSLRGGRLGETLTGPALVEFPDTVVVLRPGQSASFDEYGNLVIDLYR